MLRSDWSRKGADTLSELLWYFRGTSFIFDAVTIIRVVDIRLGFRQMDSLVVRTRTVVYSYYIVKYIYSSTTIL